MLRKLATWSIPILLVACGKDDALPPPHPIPGTGDGTMVDNDGNIHPTVIIGGQEWMAENLRVTRYRNGDPILTDLSIWEWRNVEEGAYAPYGNDSVNTLRYGLLYNGYAVSDPRCLCPSGWHVSTSEEWTAMVDFLGGLELAGSALKTPGNTEAGTGLWRSPNPEADNSSGFSALPGGVRSYGATYLSVGSSGAWWTITIGDQPTTLWSWSLFYLNSAVTPHEEFIRSGLSVRCVRDR